MPENREESHCTPEPFPGLRQAPAVIRGERPEDVNGIRSVQRDAFGRADEARLVDALRDSAGLSHSLVAVQSGAIVGHIAFSPVSVVPALGNRLGFGLAPVAVLPAFQRQGIGARLIQSGLEECRRSGADFVVVLGHSEYYPRFGFVPGAPRGLRSVYPVPDDVFMVRELTPGSLADVVGLVHYHPAFAMFE